MPLVLGDNFHPEILADCFLLLPGHLSIGSIPWLSSGLSFSELIATFGVLQTQFYLRQAKKRENAKKEMGKKRDRHTATAQLPRNLNFESSAYYDLYLRHDDVMCALGRGRLKLICVDK